MLKNLVKILPSQKFVRLNNQTSCRLSVNVFPSFRFVYSVAEFEASVAKKRIEMWRNMLVHKRLRLSE